MGVFLADFFWGGERRAEAAKLAAVFCISLAECRTVLCSFFFNLNLNNLNADMELNIYPTEIVRKVKVKSWPGFHFRIGTFGSLSQAKLCLSE